MFISALLFYHTRIYFRQKFLVFKIQFKNHFHLFSHNQPLFLVSDISERFNGYCKKCINDVISCDHSIFYDNHNYY